MSYPTCRMEERGGRRGVRAGVRGENEPNLLVACRFPEFEDANGAHELGVCRLIAVREVDQREKEQENQCCFLPVVPERTVSLGSFLFGFFVKRAQRWQP